MSDFRSSPGTVEAESRLPLQYEDGHDYCTVKDAQGRDFALTMQPEFMKAMERALREDIARLSRRPADANAVPHDLLNEIIAHLGASIIQSVPTDDQIIIDHVKAAHELAKAARRQLSKVSA